MSCLRSTTVSMVLLNTDWGALLGWVAVRPSFASCHICGRSGICPAKAFVSLPLLCLFLNHPCVQVHNQIENGYAVVLPLYAGGVAWTLVYDTIYAHQDKNVSSTQNCHIASVRTCEKLVRLPHVRQRRGGETDFLVSEYGQPSSTNRTALRCSSKHASRYLVSSLLHRPHRIT